MKTDILKTVYIDGENLTLEDVELVARDRVKVELSKDAFGKINAARKFVEEVINEGTHVYGINTGFGALSNVIIPDNQIENLQLNLIRSHACGVGVPHSEEVTRAIILLRANTLAKGFSGIRLETVNTMLELLNKQVHPVIPSQGSVGASGDLVPLAHLALVLVGEGKAIYKGQTMSGLEALNKAGIKPIVLGAKEGLALTNGTQSMCGMATLRLLEAERLVKISDIAGAMTLEAIRGTSKAFDPKIQNLRRHPGQIATAKNLLKLLADSEIMLSHNDCGKIQDPYSVRCMPQVHGATRDALNYVRKVLEIEVNSATDNPLIFAEERETISGGNFHGQPLAFAMDFLGIAVAELASISERRIDKLIAPAFSDLPPFLTNDSGINSGLMIVQYTAASLVSENKILAHPASVDSIPTSLDKEDHVSMGATAALKAENIIKNTRNVLAIELLTAYQGINFLKTLSPGIGVKIAHETIGRTIPEISQDRVFSDDIYKIAEMINSNEILDRVQEVIGELE
ncbi:MAG: histidine ammonia-lyase [Candidatus Gastranaerophilales bacterium]|nr:histidine ammonia-lyase [Candidatus Gastranaerophilales bacterium]